MTTYLYLARHAQAEHGDGDLTALGAQQAWQLGVRLVGVPFDVLRHSPVPRAAQTASIVAGHLPGVPVESSELIRDRTPVPGAGELPAAVPASWREFLARVPAGERDHGGELLDKAFDELARPASSDRHELLVTHNFVIGWFVRRALDAPRWRWLGLNQANCALTLIECRPGYPPVLVSFNDASHLA